MNQDVKPMPQGISEKNLTLVIYLMYGLYFAFGVTFVIALMINYLKRNEIKDELIKSHNEWQIKSAWFFIIGFALSIVGLFFLMYAVRRSDVSVLLFGLLFIANNLRFLFCIVKGALRLSEGKPMA